MRRGQELDPYYRYLNDEIDFDGLRACSALAAHESDRSACRLTLGPDTHEVTRELITDRLGRTPLWVLIGGPPCQAYSLAGRARMRHTDGFETDERHFLYREYLRVLADHQPPVFVMENVRGLLSAKHGGESMILRILADLQHPNVALKLSTDRHCEYRLFGLAPSGGIFETASPGDFLVRAEEHGVPQARHRVFILGIRNDIRSRPRHLAQRPACTVRQMIGDLPPIRSGITGNEECFESWIDEIQAIASLDLKGPYDASGIVDYITRRMTCAPLRRSESRPPRFVQSDTPAVRFVRDPKVRALNGHFTRPHMPSDLRRYAYAAAFAQRHGKSPRLQEFPRVLLPAHRDTRDGQAPVHFVDRFKVQLPDRVASTVTAHIAKDGHYYIHYDVAQCRSLSVREAARLQTFPDNYIFQGPRSEQFKQIGNAVPPYLAAQIGAVVAEVLDAEG